MSLFEAFLLGLIQGITEFLPISSSAHLILVPYVLGWEDHSLRFDVVTNAATLLAALIYFRRDLVASLGEMQRDGVLTVRRWIALDARPGLLLAIAVATLPVLAVGFLFYDWFAVGARNPTLIACSSIVFGILLWWADRRASATGRSVAEIRWSDSLWIGLAEAVALIPGTSRSGITITAGLLRGMGRADAARFSLLLAIPVGAVALLNDLVQGMREGFATEELAPLVVGFASAAISAYLVIGWLLRWLQRQTMTVFVVYRVALGLLILVKVWLLST
ncbi:MAG: undecaprenyl-diphosphate phosphatase [Acidobacteriota bacterium]